MSNNKIIVISDIHMCMDDKGLFKEPCVGYLVDLLKRRVVDDASVGELVLLGDIFDTWSYTRNAAPDKKKLINYWMQYDGGKVKDILNECSRKKKVYYILGNHDMEIKEDDLKPHLEKIQIKTPGDFSQGHKGLRLEHGHAEDMFNAPANSKTKNLYIQGFPLGYFITRLAFTTTDGVAARKGFYADLRVDEKKKDLLVKMPEFESFSMSSKPVPNTNPDLALLKLTMYLALIYLMIKSGTAPWEKIKMPSGFRDVSMVEVLQIGDMLVEHWYKVIDQRSFWRSVQSMCASECPLDWYAYQLLQRDETCHKVIMGHTHKASGTEPDFQYANTGCFYRKEEVDPLTYGEIDDDKITILTFEP